MRWRLEGTNWEGRQWITADAIATLAGQIDSLYPAPHGADGTVASQQHDQNNPSSDHRPTPYTGPGTVRAIDVGGPAAGDLAETLRLGRDPRINYVINQGRKFSSAPSGGRPAWEWGAYTGSNPHADHFHLSTLSRADDDGTAWALTMEDQLITELTQGLAGDPGRIDRLVADGVISGAGAAAYWKGLLAQPSNPEWRNFWAQVFVETALRAGNK